jgi:hypothetical protein
MIPPPWSRTPPGLTAPANRLRGLIVIHSLQLRRAVGAGLLGPGAEQPRLQQAILPLESVDIELQLRGPIRRPAMHFLPVSDLLAQFEVLGTQLRHFLAEFGGLPTQLTHLAQQLLHEARVRPRPKH